MAKDPAFLFYFRDFLVSTELMTAEEVGTFIRILCHQADKGHLSLEDMQSICSPVALTKRVQKKFEQDPEGLFFNARLEEEVNRRRAFTESRRNNAKHMHEHMGNANANGNNVFKKGIVKGKRPAFYLVQEFRALKMKDMAIKDKLFELKYTENEIDDALGKKF